MRLFVHSLCVLALLGCQQSDEPVRQSYYGTLEPMASENVYFLMTDRFVDGDPDNNFPEQGGMYPTWQGKLEAEDGSKAYVGYLGGDFKGILKNAAYLRELGFSAVWLTPIVEQPDQAFAGGEKIEFGGKFKDGGKSGYHGYWGVNFYELDEHLPSKDLDFEGLVSALEEEHQIKTVLDVVMNHGSPSFSMSEDQPMYGEIYDQDGSLIADHMNLPPENLDPNNPLHEMFNTKKDIMQLSDMNETNPKVMDYFVGAYSHWLDQGAHALRIDTIKHMPIDFWREFAKRIRKHKPEIFMFAEAFQYDAEFIAQYTLEENGRISVLDFPQQAAMLKVFETDDGNYADLLPVLHITKGPYENPYDLMTFYDNHDMSRINTDTNGYINVHNWLFTSRGIPVVYYGSETGYMTGAAEHAGGRNYYGQRRINEAPKSAIYKGLQQIAEKRLAHVALQRGVQLNLDFTKDTASFLRVFEHEGDNETILVLLNKSDETKSIRLLDYLSAGEWTESFSGQKKLIAGMKHAFQVAPNSVQLWVLQEANTNQTLLRELDGQMRR
ncbi:MAG: cyclomaltodextrin glucanotransferase [Gammaproteobacteria bacterium]|nr:cyclomaltodextrin glucanotransferase [Gammaproteobacteria bacterium]NNJ72377.1 cyclomaltodextrin glucanotransferase [Enterobacterales bacterium]